MSQINNTLPLNIKTTFLQAEKLNYDKIYYKSKNKLIQKISQLQNKKTNHQSVNKNWIINLTNIHIPENIKYILSLGPNYSTFSKKIPYFDIIASIEANITQYSIDTQNQIRNGICNIITNFKNKLKHKKFINNNNTINSYRNKLNKDIKTTKAFIKAHPNLHITSADKSKKTVIMQKTEYNTKMLTLLNDQFTYKLINSDPTNKIQTNINKIIQDLYSSNTIDLNTKNQLIRYNSKPPYIRGLPKTHKPNIPLRPIVNNIQSPTYNIAKYLNNILTQITGKTSYHIKNSSNFKDFIKQQTIPGDHVIISLDVESLYTNIPTDLALQIIENNWIKIKNLTSLNQSQFLKITKTCLDSSYFTFENKFYSQIKGLAMGSPLAASLANIVMEHIEEQVLSSLDYNPIFFKRYVDDIITCIPKNKIDYTLNKFNNYHTNINFTIEIEKNQSINFLDLNIKYDNNGTIFTNWYNKDTASFRYINYNSTTPHRYKKNTIQHLTDKAITLAHPKYRKQNITKIKHILQQNNYPNILIDKTIKKRIHQIYNHNNTNTSKNSKFISLPYVENLSENINKYLKKFNITAAFKQTNTLKDLYTSHIPLSNINQRTHIVYKIPCNSCNACYIGQTKQYLEKRLDQHKKSKENQTALATHKTNTGHDFNYNQTKILDTETNYKKRIIKEMIYIKKDKNAINHRTDIKNLNSIYFSLISEN